MSQMGQHSKKRGCGVFLYALLGLGLAALLLLSGCGSDTHKSAPEVDCNLTAASGQPKICTTPRTVRIIQNPEGFRNIVVACDDFGTGLYVTSRGDIVATPVGSDIALYPHDPSCPQPKTTPSPPQ